jgi:hypothetical protein
MSGRHIALEEIFQKAIQHGTSSSLQHPFPGSASKVPPHDSDVYADVPFYMPPSMSPLM